MIHKILIYHTSGKKILSSTFSDQVEKINLDNKLFGPIINATLSTEQKISYMTIGEFRIIFKINGDITVIIIADENDSKNVLDEYSLRILKRYRLRYGDSIEGIPSEEVTTFLEILNKLVTQPTITLKIILIGEPSTGKSSILKILSNEPLPKWYTPSVEANGEEFSNITDEAIVYVWDLPGKEEHRWLWERYISGTDIILIVTDSTTPNILTTMESWGAFKSNVPSSIQICGLANMQDKKDALDPEVVGNILGFKTYPTSSKELGERENLIKVFKEICENYILKGIDRTIDNIERIESNEILDSILAIKQGLLKALPPNHPIFVGIESWIDKIKMNPTLNDADIREFNNALSFWKQKMEELM